MMTTLKIHTTEEISRAFIPELKTELWIQKIQNAGSEEPGSDLPDSDHAKQKNQQWLKFKQ